MTQQEALDRVVDSIVGWVQLDEPRDEWSDRFELTILAVANAFVAAIRPASLTSLALNRPRLDARVARFLAVQDWPDGDIVAWAKILYKARDNKMTRWERFQQRVPAIRIRTYTEEILVDVIKIFLHWDPTIEELERGAEVVPGIEEFHMAAKALEKRRPDAGADAAQKAFLAELSALRAGNSGYIYEDSFVGWLKQKAAYAALDHRWQRVVPIDAGNEEDEPVPEPPASPTRPLTPDTLREMSARFLLVATFFQPERWNAVKAVWRSLFLGGTRQLLPLQGQDLRNTTNLLRQRLRVLRYTRDCDRTHQEPDEQTMFEYVARRSRHSPSAEPTLRRIAALGRAATAAPVELLIWSILARLLVDGRGGHIVRADRAPTRDEVLNFAKEMLKRSFGVVPEDSKERLERARSYCWEEFRIKRQQLRTRWEEQRIEYRKSPADPWAQSRLSAGTPERFLAACWSMTVLRWFKEPEIIGTLWPDPREIPEIKAILEKL